MATVLQRSTAEEINDADHHACFPWSMPKEQVPAVRYHYQSALIFVFVFFAFDSQVDTSTAHKNLHYGLSNSHILRKGPPHPIYCHVLGIISQYF